MLVAVVDQDRDLAAIDEIEAAGLFLDPLVPPVRHGEFALQQRRQVGIRRVAKDTKRLEKDPVGILDGRAQNAVAVRRAVPPAGAGEGPVPR